MLKKLLFNPQHTQRLQNIMKKNFGRGGPYNPNRYKNYYVPRTQPKNEEILEYVGSLSQVPSSPVRNLRHINPVR